jgi:Holliday junction DNA helicase RuvA
MIFFLKGKIVYKGDEFFVLETNNIGYQIFVSNKFLKKIKINDQIKVFTYLYLRDETQEIYGFESLEELEFFKKLLTISGVGPKIAQGILSLGKIPEIKKAIQNGKVDFLTKVEGVGKKIAQKIILELSGKIEEILKPKLTDKKLINALLKLGYRKNEIKEVLSQIPPEIEKTEEKIKYALKILGKK